MRFKLFVAVLALLALTVPAMAGDFPIRLESNGGVQFPLTGYARTVDGRSYVSLAGLSVFSFKIVNTPFRCGGMGMNLDLAKEHGVFVSFTGYPIDVPIYRGFRLAPGYGFTSNGKGHHPKVYGGWRLQLIYAP